MKLKSLLIIILFYLYFSQPVFTQVWPKIFGGSSNNWCNGLIESYDKGYIICVQVDPGPNSLQMHALLIKTDINGNLLWTKTIYSPLYQVAFSGIENTTDGGFVVTGGTTKLDNLNYDIIFMKFNACGEKEWCKIVSTPANDDNGLKIKQISDGYIALIKYFQDWTTKRIWLFRMDMSGNIIWEILINESNSTLQNSEGRDLIGLSDNNYLVTGDGYDLGSGQTFYLRPLIIRTDSNANVQWTLPFGHNNGFRGDFALYPNENQSGFFYISAEHFRDTAPYGDSPCFLKVNSSGLEEFYKDLIPNSVSGGSTSLNLWGNDSLFISAVWKDVSNVWNIGIFKTDTLGNITKTKIIFQNIQQSLTSTLFTFDNKYLAAGNFNATSINTKIYLYKFTIDLEYAPLNTQPRTYDSLCPHPVVSDTMNLDDCGVITSIHDPVNEPGFYNLKLYPNPATDKVTIEFPELLLKK